MDSKELVRQAILSVPAADILARGGAVPNLIWQPRCDGKKVRNAIESYAWGAKAEDVLAIEDSTRFGSGKKGVLVTAKGVYASEPGWPNGAKFEELDHLEMREEYILNIFFRDGRMWPPIARYQYNIWMCEAINAVLRALKQGAPETVPEPAPVSGPAAGPASWPESASQPEPEPAAALEQAFQNAETLCAAADYDAALEKLLPFAKKENADAQFRCAMLYDKMEQMEQHEALVQYWLGKAFENGHEEAGKLCAEQERKEQARIEAVMVHSPGQVVMSAGPAALTRAERAMWTKVWEDIVAQERSGYEYEHKLVMQSFALGDAAGALQLLRSIALFDSAGAQVQYGEKVLAAETLPEQMGTLSQERIEVEGYRWIWKAARQGHARAKEKIKGLLATQEGKEILTKVREEERKDQLEFWKLLFQYGETRTLPEENREERLRDMVRMYEARKLRLVRNYTAAFERNWRLAQKGYAAAKREVAEACKWGQGTKADQGKAMEYLLEAAEQGDAPAMNTLSVMYALGDGVEQDDAMSCYWSRRRKAHLDAEGQYDTGMFYYEQLQEIETREEEIAQNKRTAFVWFDRSARRGYLNAQMKLGAMYFRGEAVEKDLLMARFWFEKAARQGSIEGAFYTGMLYCEKELPGLDIGRAVPWLLLATHSEDEFIVSRARMLLDRFA